MKRNRKAITSLALISMLAAWGIGRNAQAQAGAQGLSGKGPTGTRQLDALRLKGVTVSPTGSFLESATAWRSAATGGGIATPFPSIPLQGSDAARRSEFFASARQSRVALKATGKLSGVKLTGCFEMDWLGTGKTANSYLARDRQIWLRAAFADGWTISAGRMWSLATETAHGLDNGTETLPSTIDPQYNAGFVWARQYGVRITKDFGNRFWIGASVENPRTRTGGAFAGSVEHDAYNVAPDIIAKVAWQPGWGHYGLFGIARFFRNRIYPDAPASSAGAYNDSTVGGGIGASLRVPFAGRKILFGLEGLYGDGVGRYGDSTLPDITFKPGGQISPLHGFSALETLEFHPVSRLTIYTNYGGDYAGRDIHGDSGYGLRTADMSGCRTEALPSGAFNPGTTDTCDGDTKDVQEGTVGYWFNVYKGSKGTVRQGLQYSYVTRNLWSGAGGAANPGGGAEGTDHVFESSLRYYLP